MCDVVCLPVLHNLPFPSIIVHSLILRITHLASLHQSDLGPAASEDEMQLTKSTDRKIAGVCGGIAEWLGWSAASIRALFVIVSVFFWESEGFYSTLSWLGQCHHLVTLISKISERSDIPFGDRVNV